MSKPDGASDRSATDRPAEPFKSLGNETRLEILRVLYERTRGSGSWESAVSYSDLREAVGVRDKGNFNYHLRQLDGQFVEDADGTGDDSGGYQLTFAGFEIATVIDMDAWRSHEPRGPVALEIGADGGVDRADEGETDDDSIDGGGETEGDDSGVDGGGATDEHEPEPLTAVYEDSVVELRRGDDTLYAHALRPAGAADRGMEMDALLEVASTLWRQTIESILEGICPYCHATAERSLEPEDVGHWTHSFTASCSNCGSLGGSHVGVVLLVHPAAVSFCWDHSIDVTDRRFWTLPFVDDGIVTVADEEPRRLRLAVELDGDRLEALVDDSVTVTDTVRHGAANERRGGAGGMGR
ncbi:winged helix-turn-helix domain-containing protein [Natrarchaeobius chitinivorans]|uniref:ArsR family transcriptional regulator n=1 Tax=Natrarchaeobius chitinivorans TaxID=1679083 RepID=A0A3N6MNZ2_NATCH|nr:winged helix-turn-helix domain-containing protein [Natrarchaeobius chitinivorans]RQG97861.1 ArsR family transcriptional regulator [Natrarchaeobius chitinivorans]